MNYSVTAYNTRVEEAGEIRVISKPHWGVNVHEWAPFVPPKTSLLKTENQNTGLNASEIVDGVSIWRFDKRDVAFNPNPKICGYNVTHGVLNMDYAKCVKIKTSVGVSPRKYLLTDDGLF